jgi:xylulokinase
MRDASFYTITYDVGTTGIKTCLYKIADKITLVESAYAGYNLYIMEDGGAEQDPEEWWTALCDTTKEALAKARIDGAEVRAVSFCSQMQCLVLVDKNGEPVRRAMSYMDGRAADMLKAFFGVGLKIQGMNIRRLLTWLRITKAAPISVKDPLWKYLWVKANEPEIFARVDKWLDAKDYLTARFTGVKTMTEGSAYPTFLMDIRPGHRGWSRKLCRMAGVDMKHLPTLINAWDKVGGITQEASAMLGLREGAAVYGGGGDAELIGIGVGAVRTGDTHLYFGTSGWVSTVTDRQLVDLKYSIAAIVGSQKDKYHYFAEMETAGKCLEWVKDHLALDEIGVYLGEEHVTQPWEILYVNLYDYLCEVLDKVPAGSGGVIFTPWLHGNRCPFEDANARGMFFNIGLETGKSELIRAVVEGIAFHCRSMLEAQERKLKTSDTIYMCGGGASSAVLCQIFADILGRPVATVSDSQNVGAMGAAILVSYATGHIPSIEDAPEMLGEYKFYSPRIGDKPAYDKNYATFMRLYNSNKKNFGVMNG